MKIVFRAFLSLMTVVVLVVAAVFFALNSSAVTQRVLPRLVNSWFARAMPAAPLRVESFSLKDQHFFLPGFLSLSGVDLAVVSGKERYYLSLSRLEVEGLASLLGGECCLHVKMREGKASGGPLTLEAGRIVLDLVFDQQGFAYPRGRVSQAALRLGDYEITGIGLAVSGRPGRVAVPSLQAGFYGGTLGGKIIVDYRPGLAYDIDIILSGVDSRKLAAVNAAAFSQVQGLISGAVSVAGDGSRVRSLKGTFNALSGGLIKAALLGPFVTYIPQSVNRARIEKAIQDNGYLPFKNGDLVIQSLDSRNLSAVVNIETSEVSLADSEINLKMDAPLEDWFKAILNITQRKE